MKNFYTEVMREQTERALWEVRNVIDCIPKELWCKCYCEMPLWKHVYHMLHSLDVWFINPRDVEFEEPAIHQKDLNNLDIVSDKSLSRDEINAYFSQINDKINRYLCDLTDDQLSEKPNHCEYTCFTLMLAQHRHLHTHMGMIMGFIIDDTQQWPYVIGLEKPVPRDSGKKYF